MGKLEFFATLILGLLSLGLNSYFGLLALFDDDIKNNLFSATIIVPFFIIFSVMMIVIILNSTYKFLEEYQ